MPALSIFVLGYLSFLLIQKSSLYLLFMTPLSKRASLVKNLPAMRETWVLSLSWKDPMEEGMASHSSILAWRITEKPGGLQSIGLQRAGYD